MVSRNQAATYLISFGEFLKLLLSLNFVVRILVRMPFHGILAICFLQLIGGGVAINAENGIVIFGHSSGSHGHKPLVLSPKSSEIRLDARLRRAGKSTIITDVVFAFKWFVKCNRVDVGGRGSLGGALL